MPSKEAPHGGSSRYILRGGAQGRERLRLLGSIWRPATLNLLQRAGIKPGMACLDVGCGGGDVSFDLARLIEPGGRVVALDADPVEIEIASGEASAQRIENIEFRAVDFNECALASEFDLAYARFVLSHLPSPTAALEKIRKALRPGGIVVVVDTDFRGLFSEPDSEAVRRYVELYTATLRRRGGDANIGPRLPGLLTNTGFENVRMNVVQHASTAGGEKVLIPMTMESSADAVVAEGLAPRAEVDALITQLYSFARAPESVLSGPRVLEAWGNRPAV